MSTPLNHTLEDNSFNPEIFSISTTEGKEKYEQLLHQNNAIIHDTILSQLKELVKIKNPSQKLSENQLKEKITEYLDGTDAKSYGNWVYYPWSNQLVHVLKEDDFIAVRTNRNMFKIAPEEIEVLRTKKIAIIGLSVGQSIAQTIATERICGELCLADFDTLELANLNRLNARIQDLGVPKVIIAARKIAEIDPYIKVRCWQEGITESNIEDFLTGGGKADVLVEECDSLPIKILSRLKARQFQIPVVMDTNDLGMLDIERFDLEQQRPIFHGKLEELDNQPHDQIFLKLKNLTTEEKFGYLVKIIGFENISDEMKFSLAQINHTITGWPQLASSVTLGAAMVTDTCRRILLGKFKNSGRFFVHFDELIK